MSVLKRAGFLCQHGWSLDEWGDTLALDIPVLLAMALGIVTPDETLAGAWPGHLFVGVARAHSETEAENEIPP